MAGAFVKVVLDNLISVMKNEIGLMMGVDKEMEKLSSTLTTIQSVLEDAEDKQFESKPIRDWLSKLNDLAYEIDDILDDCATQVSILKHKNNTVSRFNLKKIRFQHKIGRRIKKVVEKLDAVAAERLKFHLIESVADKKRGAASIRETGSILNESDHHIYGRDDDKEKIVDILVNHVKDNEQLSILPIIGMGGLGKTTLAQLIFKDPRVVEHFDTKLWVCVSDNFDVKTLVKAFIESANGSGSASQLEHLDALQNRLRVLLNHKRYLVVLDDVWNEDQEKWDMLKNVMACGSSGASIVVTTRLKNVADIMRTLESHCLKGMSDEDCWLLFKLRAFGPEEEAHPNLEVIGKQIVNKCGGVPLAAKTLGGLLRFKRGEKEWLHVKESEIWNLPQTETSIMPALRLSYRNLPIELRQCFAYCAVFPKDFTIYKDELVLSWMAHGLISSNGTMEVEDVGNETWNELLLRSFFQDVETRTSGQTVFKMHDLVHDLAQSVMENKYFGTPAENNDKRIRQVASFHYSIFFSEYLLSFTFKNFSLLRLLKAEGRSIKQLPSGIGNLKHLRLLDMSGSSIGRLPRAVCSLWNLQTLVLNYCAHLQALPKQMKCLPNLRHLFLDGCGSISHLPSKIGELTSLKTLTEFTVGDRRGSQLGDLQFLNLQGRLVLDIWRESETICVKIQMQLHYSI